MRGRSAFTLVELLVVVAIIALLIGILIPAVGKARKVAQTTKCLANIRSLEQAHWIYMSEWDGKMIDVGFAHGGAHADEEVAFINTLQDYYGNQLLARSPVDDSPHWPQSRGGQGAPIEGTSDLYRRTSYGINNLLTSKSPTGDDYMDVDRIASPSRMVHFVMMAFEGDFAGSDHTHVEGWWVSGLPQASPGIAADQVEIHAHGGPKRSFQSVTNYGFLDGHAETLRFEEVYETNRDNRFDPRVND